jgi:hypothetical protein
MNGDRHDGRGRRPDHHHRFRPMIPPAQSQLAKEFGMAEMLEAGAIEHILHDRGRDDGACPATLEGLRRPFNCIDHGRRPGDLGVAGLVRSAAFQRQATKAKLNCLALYRLNKFIYSCGLLAGFCIVGIGVSARPLWGAITVFDRIVVDMVAHWHAKVPTSRQLCGPLLAWT